MKRFVKLFAAALLLSVGATTGHAEEIKIAELNWAGSTASCWVMKLIMENYLDAEVEIVGGDEIALFEAMHKGDGTIDVFSDFWSLSLHAQWVKYIQEGSEESVKVNAKPYLGTTGIFTPGYVQDEYGLKSIEQMKDPEISKLFDTDGDGMGEYWTGAAGWQSVDRNAVKAKSMGYAEHWEPTTVETWVLEALLDAAYKRKRPILFFHYTPEWIHASYDLRRLEESPFTGFANPDMKGQDNYNPDGCYEFYQQSEWPDWLEKSSITCERPPNPVHVAYSANLHERAPTIAKFLDQIAFTVGDMSLWIKRISLEKADPETVAKEWVESNKETIEGEWLKGLL